MGLTGNTLGLRKTLAEIARVPSQAAREAAVGIDGKMKAMFTTETDPYGVPWLSLAPSTIRKKGHSLILRDTFALMDGTGAKPAPGAGIRLYVGPKGSYAQQGDLSRNRPRRRVFPDAGLPKAWRQIIEDAVADAITRAAAKRGK